MKRRKIQTSWMKTGGVGSEDRGGERPELVTFTEKSVTEEKGSQKVKICTLNRKKNPHKRKKHRKTYQEKMHKGKRGTGTLKRGTRLSRRITETRVCGL